MPLTVFAHMVSRRSGVAGLREDEFADVAVFRERVEKLAASQRKYQGIPIATFRRDDASSSISFEANTPHVDDVISLAVKFRFFYADKEPTQFQKILTKVRRRAEDEWACGYLDWLADRYRDALRTSRTSGQLGLPVSNREIIDLWFNSDFFHSDTAKKKELSDVHAKIGEAPSLYQLYVAIALCASYIRMLHSVVHKLDAEHPFIYSPNHHFRGSPST